MSHLQFFGVLFQVISKLLFHSEIETGQQQIAKMQNLTSDVFINWNTQRKAAALNLLLQEYCADETDFRTDFDLPGQKIENGTEILFDAKEDYRTLLVEFNARAHVIETLSHKKFIKKVFEKFGNEFFPNVNQQQIDAHDDSKLGSFLEVVGYTDRWVWKNTTSKVWEAALKHHYANNRHHPEFYINENGEKEDMPDSDLEESIIDMFACIWERKLGAREDVSKKELADHMDDFFLKRYTDNDRIKVKAILLTIILSSD